MDCWGGGGGGAKGMLAPSEIIGGPGPPSSYAYGSIRRFPNPQETGNKQKTNKTYDESEMMIGQKQRTVTPGDPLSVKQHHSNTGAK